MDTVSLAERLEGRIDKTADCWLWTGRKTGAGYGRIEIDHRSHYVHRVMYELWKGAIPAGLQIDHLCRIPACVNPDHLEAVTQAENMRRGVSPIAQQARQTECVRGHPLSGENLNITNAGHRQCKACVKVRSLRRRKDYAA